MMKDSDLSVAKSYDFTSEIVKGTDMWHPVDRGVFCVLRA